MKLLSTITTGLLFDGFCPESALKGEKVEMKLNDQDFWESIKTRLQITTFPPYAAILAWRGKGIFKIHEEIASNHHKELIICTASIEKGKEIFPNEKEVINNSFDLEYYINSIYDNYEDYLKDLFNPQQNVLIKQREYLNQIADEEWENLIESYRDLKREGLGGEAFPIFHAMLYDLKIIFSFNWIRWNERERLLIGSEADFEKLNLLEISMLLTFIFRSDRFNDVSIINAFNKGILDKIFKRLDQIT